MADFYTQPTFNDGIEVDGDIVLSNGSGSLNQVITKGVSGTFWATPTSSGGYPTMSAQVDNVLAIDGSGNIGITSITKDVIVYATTGSGSRELNYLGVGTGLQIVNGELETDGSSGSSPWTTDVAGIYYNNYIGVGAAANTGRNISVGSKGIYSEGPIGVDVSPLAPGHFATNTTDAAQPTLIVENTNSTSNSDTFVTFIKEKTPTDTMWHMGVDGATQAFRVVLGTGGSPKNFGTGSEAFRVAFNDRSVVFTDDVSADNFILNSDERLKENIEDIDYDKHIKADWKTFNLIKDKEDKRHGVIAQELEVHHPEFVNTDEEGYKSVQYIDLLIAKIAELEARLEKLEK